MRAWTDLKTGDVVYLRVNPEVIHKGYLALEVRWVDGYPIGQEPGDHMEYRLDKWWNRLEFKKP